MPAGGTSWTPVLAVHEQVGEAAHLVAVGLGHADISEMTSIGSLPAKSPIQSNSPPSSSAGRGSGSVISLDLGSSSGTRRGVNARGDQLAQPRAVGGSIARNDMVRWASGGQRAGRGRRPLLE